MILFEELEANRYELKNPVTGRVKVLVLKPEQEKNRQKFLKNSKTGKDYDIIDQQPLAEWLCNNYKEKGIKLEIITDKSPEGFQFVKGFGGIGGFFRYKVNLEELMD